MTLHVCGDGGYCVKSLAIYASFLEEAQSPKTFLYWILLQI